VTAVTERLTTGFGPFFSAERAGYPFMATRPASLGRRIGRRDNFLQPGVVTPGSAS
jgi:hypothetical protein